MAIKWTVGEIRRASELGYKRTTRYIWHACEVCGKERWVQFIKGQPARTRCFKCAHQNNHKSNWKGGKTRNPSGYIRIRLQPDDFFFPMADKAHYVQEHRLVMAKHLNRCLLPWEIVHHKGTKYPLGSIEDKGDNRIENLELITDKRFHMVDMRAKNLINDLQKRVTLLEAEVVILKTQLSLTEAQR
jgi:hypothetical protein